MLKESAVVMSYDVETGLAKVKCQSQSACGACSAREACGTASAGMSGTGSDRWKYPSASSDDRSEGTVYIP